MKRRHLILNSVLGILLIFNFLYSSVDVYANSAPSHWTGTTSIGTIVKDDNCPITVEKEDLTFDIQDFPEMYSADDSYSAKVTAKYTFHNPTEQAIKATLVFPFGKMPEYISQQNAKQYGVMINDSPIEASLHHTLIEDGEEFNLDDSLSRLQDEMMGNNLYKKDTVVTRYAFEVEGNLDEYPNAIVSMTLTDIGNRIKLSSADANGYEINDNQITLDHYPSESIITLDIIGGDLTKTPELLVYSDGMKEKKLDYNVKLSSTTEFTLEQYLLLEYDSSLGISEIDWYNAAFTCLNTTFEDETYVEYAYLHQINQHLMQWYVYDITIEPGQSITNTVTAPLYPDCNGAYSSPLYTYNYLLSPAKEWADFQELTITVNTPYYMINNSLGGMDKTETGFTMHLNKLPDKELTFELCEESNPTSNSNFGLIVKVFGGIILGALAIIVLVVVLLVKLFRR